MRSEERRVGKECRYRWSAYHLKKKRSKQMQNKPSCKAHRPGPGLSLPGCREGGQAFVFFEADDGIRQGRVTGVQTCARRFSFARLRKRRGGVVRRRAIADCGKRGGDSAWVVSQSSGRRGVN